MHGPSRPYVTEWQLYLAEQTVRGNPQILGRLCATACRSRPGVASRGIERPDLRKQDLLPPRHFPVLMPKALRS